MLFRTCQDVSAQSGNWLCWFLAYCFQVHNGHLVQCVHRVRSRQGYRDMGNRGYGFGTDGHDVFSRVLLWPRTSNEERPSRHVLVFFRIAADRVKQGWSSTDTESFPRSPHLVLDNSQATPRIEGLSTSCALKSARDSHMRHKRPGCHPFVAGMCAVKWNVTRKSSRETHDEDQKDGAISATAGPLPSTLITTILKFKNSPQTYTLHEILRNKWYTC